MAVRQGRGGCNAFGTKLTHPQMEVRFSSSIYGVFQSVASGHRDEPPGENAPYNSDMPKGNLCSTGKYAM